MRAMNLLEYDDLVKGMSDAQLIQAVQNPPPGFPQFLAVDQLKANKETREKYAAELNKPSDMTIADQVLGEAMQGGVMSAMPQQMAQGMPPQGMPRMPQQMAMTPQMPQGMPQMPPQAPPQGIQQVMPPQMMSGGGVVRMANGGDVLEEVVAKAPNLSEQKLEELIMDGVPAIDLIQMGFTSDDISRVGSQIEPKLVREARKVGDYLGVTDFIGGVTDFIGGIPSTSVLDPNRAEEILRRGQQQRDQQISGAQASFLGRTDIPRGEDPAKPFTTNITLPFGAPKGPFADLVGAGITGIGNAYDRFMDRSNRLAEERAVSQDAGSDTPTNTGKYSVPAISLDNNTVLTEEQVRDNLLVGADASANNPAEKAHRDQSPHGIERVELDDATMPSGADAAAGRLSDLQAMIDRQSAASSKASQGAALIALGTSIMEGKTAQGGAKAGEILAKDAQTRGALQLEGAKLRLADARQGEKLDIMRQDLLNKLQITDRQSLMAALKSYGDSITVLGNDRTRLMTKEGQALMDRLSREQSLLRSLLIPDVNLGGAGTPAPTSPQPSGVDLDNPKYKT
jgi:hypothetical protein